MSDKDHVTLSLSLVFSLCLSLSHTHTQHSHSTHRHTYSTVTLRTDTHTAQSLYAQTHTHTKHSQSTHRHTQHSHSTHRHTQHSHSTHRRAAPTDLLLLMHTAQTGLASLRDTDRHNIDSWGVLSWQWCLWGCSHPILAMLRLGKCVEIIQRAALRVGLWHRTPHPPNPDPPTGIETRVGDISSLGLFSLFLCWELCHVEKPLNSSLGTWRFMRTSYLFRECLFTLCLYEDLW